MLSQKRTFQQDIKEKTILITMDHDRLSYTTTNISNVNDSDMHGHLTNWGAQDPTKSYSQKQCQVAYFNGCSLYDSDQWKEIGLVKFMMKVAVTSWQFLLR